MTIDRQLYDFMPHTVTIQAFSSNNNYGEQTHSVVTRTAKAYVEPNTVMSFTKDARDQHYPKKIYVADTNITLQDKITLPDGTIPRIDALEKHIEVTGLEHTIVTFA